ncbi:MAG: class I SAM-dependent methyltransferase [Acetobacteraceae bacterium]|nr:class I SAM-dependent methyltransferase [Acetobacteraceae bacterium]
MRDENLGLEGFYTTPTGLVAARLLRERLRAFWPSLPRQSVMGLGYASPFLRLWRAEAARCVAVVPPHLPRWRWPRKAACRTAVAEDDALPFPDLSFDRILLVHGLETTENARRLLREAWRVLKDDGRLLVAAPNRLSFWAQMESTPFGHGQPYSPGQLERLLRRQMFSVERRGAALFVPPFKARVLLRSAEGWERVGPVVFPRFAGLTLLEAEKDMFAAIPAPATAETGRPLRRRVSAAVTERA